MHLENRSLKKGIHRSTATLKVIQRKTHFFPKKIKRGDHKAIEMKAPHDPHYILCCCLEVY